VHKKHSHQDKTLFVKHGPLQMGPQDLELGVELVPQREVKPLERREVKPVVQREVKPVVQREVKPLERREVEPVEQQELVRVKQDQRQIVQRRIIK